jgi:MraZ protein
MDKKGRVFLPKRFQDGLTRDSQDNLCGVLTFGFEGCLYIYSQEGFEVLRERHTVDVFQSQSSRRRSRAFFSKVRPFTLDGSGRMLVPDMFRTHADLDGEAIMVGVSDHAELWSIPRWEAQQALEDDFDSLGNGDGFGQEPQ